MTTYRYCTPEWLAASAEGYRATDRFRDALRKVSTTVVFRVRAEPTWGINEDILFGTSVNQGELLSLDFFDEAEATDAADFILSATPQEWKQILRKEHKFVTDFMLGKIALEQGSKVGILAIAPYSDTLVAALTQYDLQFPDEMSSEELSEYAAYLEAFREELRV